MPKTKVLVKKISLKPTRSIDMGPRGWVTLAAGIEVELDPPVDIENSKELKTHFKKVRKMVNSEMNSQYAPYKEAKKAKKKE